MLALPMLASCSKSASRQSAPPIIGVHDFSPEDKRVARALSVGNDTIAADASPYAQALLCSDAITTVGQRLRETGALNAQMTRDIERAQEVYDAVVRAQIGKGGKTAGAVEQDRRATAAADADIAIKARRVVTCLQRLDQTA